MIRVCANGECQAYLGDERSEADDRYCPNCGDFFPSFQPRKSDDPYKIHEDALVDGAEVSAEQCDNCGNAEYRITQVRRNFRAVCTQCQTEWPVFLEVGRKIVW